MYEIFDELCKANGVTPYRVSQETGVSTASLSNWKAGNYKLKQDKLQKIADFFGVSLEYLTTGKERESPYDKYAVLLTGIMKDYELLEALKSYSKLPPDKKKHIAEVLKLLCSE